MNTRGDADVTSAPEISTRRTTSNERLGMFASYGPPWMISPHAVITGSGVCGAIRIASAKRILHGKLPSQASSACSIASRSVPAPKSPGVVTVNVRKTVMVTDACDLDPGGTLSNVVVVVNRLPLASSGAVTVNAMRLSLGSTAEKL